MNGNNKHKDGALRAALDHKVRTIKEPMLSDGFIEHLMQRIEAEETAPGRQAGNWWLNAVSIISTIAAVLVVAFLISQQKPASAEREQAYTYYHIANLPKSSTLEQVYTRHPGQKESKQLSYKHLKRMIYESK